MRSRRSIAVVGHAGAFAVLTLTAAVEALPMVTDINDCVEAKKYILIQQSDSRIYSHTPLAPFALQNMLVYQLKLEVGNGGWHRASWSVHARIELLQRLRRWDAMGGIV